MRRKGGLPGRNFELSFIDTHLFNSSFLDVCSIARFDTVRIRWTQIARRICILWEKKSIERVEVGVWLLMVHVN